MTLVEKIKTFFKRCDHEFVVSYIYDNFFIENGIEYAHETRVEKCIKCDATFFIGNKVVPKPKITGVSQ